MDNIQWWFDEHFSEFLMVLICAMVMIFVALMLVDVALAKPYPVQGVVVGMNYSPASSSSGVVIGSDGKPSIISTSKSAQWELIVEINDRVKVYGVPPELYYSVKVGEHISIPCTKSQIFHFVDCGG
jgi:hypothetical protein